MVLVPTSVAAAVDSFHGDEACPTCSLYINVCICLYINRTNVAKANHTNACAVHLLGCVVGCISLTCLILYCMRPQLLTKLHHLQQDAAVLAQTCALLLLVLHIMLQLHGPQPLYPPCLLFSCTVSVVTYTPAHACHVVSHTNRLSMQ